MLRERALWGQPRSLLEIIAFGCGAVVAVDATGSVISTSYQVAYWTFFLPSLAAYTLIGVLLSSRSLPVAAGGGLFVAIFDSTFGMWIAHRLGATQLKFSSASHVAIVVSASLIAVGLQTSTVIFARVMVRRSRARRRRE